MRPEGPAIVLRAAVPADADAVADLHARSWRTAYRGSFSDAYLDGPIDGERQAFWRQRLHHPTPDLWTILAERDGHDGLAGFLCARLDHDARWGSLVDNLHTAPDLKRHGIGRTLMTALGRHLEAVGSTAPVHLIVLRSNHAAAAFYAALGGEAVEALVTTEPDGSTLPVTRIAWPSLAAFLAQGAP